LEASTVGFLGLFFLGPRPGLVSPIVISSQTFLGSICKKFGIYTGHVYKISSCQLRVLGGIAGKSIEKTVPLQVESTRIGALCLAAIL